MVYELYVDTLFGVNFVMNLYLLILVNQRCMRTATRMRILAGAGVGAIAYTAAFLIRMPAGLKWPVMLIGGSGLMLWITFRPANFKSFLKLFWRLSTYTFLMGGLLLFWGNTVPMFQTWLTTGTGVLGIGAVIFLMLGYGTRQEIRKKVTSECNVRLSAGNGVVTVLALVDSGNSLTEPISQKPVAVMGQELFGQLWPEPPALYRVVPYRSVGKAHGILRCYSVPEMEVDLDGIKKSFRDVWVAVSEEPLSGLILNPGLLAEADAPSHKTGFRKRKERVDRNDPEGGNAGKTAI